MTERGRTSTMAAALVCLRFLSERQTSWHCFDLADRLECSPRNGYRWIEALGNHGLVERERVPRANGKGSAYSGRWIRTLKAAEELARIA